MKNYIEQGDFLTVTTENNFNSGDLFVKDSLVGVCTTATNSLQVSIATGGVYELQKDPTIEISLGQKVYAKPDEPVTTEKTGASYVGVALEEAEIKTKTIKVRLG